MKNESFCKTCGHSLGVYGYYQMGDQLKVMEPHTKAGHDVVMLVVTA